MRLMAPIAAVALLGAVACKPKASKAPAWVQGIPEEALTSVSGQAGFILANKDLQSAITKSPLAEQMLDLFLQKAQIKAQSETGRITFHLLDLPQAKDGVKGVEAMSGAFLIHLSGFKNPQALQAAVTESFPAEGFLRVRGEDWPQFVIMDLQQGGKQLHLRVATDPQGNLWLGDLSALARLGPKSLADRPGVAAAAQWLTPDLKLQGSIRPDPILGGLKQQLPSEWARELPEGVDTILWGAGPQGDGSLWTFEVVLGGEPKAISQVTPWLQRLGAALDAVRPQGQTPVQILQEGRRAGLKATLDPTHLETALGKLGLPQLKLTPPVAAKPAPKA
ncbi:MAG TPA: hypothetical protein VJ505_00325 [Holophagaceae bacterium]|nr:hypothetical protein [Holophagaceae bacterium]